MSKRGLAHGVAFVACCRSAEQDAKAGRLKDLPPVGQFPVEEVLLHPRFPVEQVRADWSVKIRDVDHFSWVGDEAVGSVNANTVPTEKLSHDTIDVLGEALRLCVVATGAVRMLLVRPYVSCRGALVRFQV